ncbi:uncharacterized protein LOC136086975 [Hydra vulgaris]|uniref:Uncharacterized protein LOC136086975 n=1 Tax=Hydra vulgaris TaxID=6087 RepID=A0ABM4CUE4_HYDVU
MGKFIDIFYAPKFLTNEKPDIAPLQDLNSIWKISRYVEDEPAIKDNSEITKIKSKLREIEDRSRRNNLRIDGLKESENENWNKTELKVQKFFEDLLGLKSIKIERAHRTGIRDSKKIRTVVIKLLNYKDKVAILKNVQKLKGKKVYVNEDYCAETILIRKDLKERMKKERELGKFAIISYDKLIVRGFERKSN